MKHNLLVVVVSVLFINNIANSSVIYKKNGDQLDLYGKIISFHHFSRESLSDRNPTYTRLGFRGETKINDQLIGYGRWEYHFSAYKAENNFNAKDSNKTILSYAGLKIDDHNSLDYGRNYGIIYDALVYTDILPAFGGDTTYDNNFLVGRVGGIATYRNTNFFGLIDGLNLAIQYLDKNEHKNKNINDGFSSNKNSPNHFGDINHSNGKGWGASLSYQFDTISIVSAYGKVKRTNAQNALLLGRGKRAEQWASGLKYNANNIYLGANYGESHNATPINRGFANKTHDIILVAQYQLDFGLRPSISYIQSKAKDMEDIGSENLIKYVEIGAVYFFNKNFSSFIDYKINQIDRNNKLSINSSDNIALGIMYKF